MMPHPEKPESGGFTLLELLVVIAVLAMLIAIITPALHTAKLVAKQVVCASQMRQWVLAELAYTTENDNIVSPYADTCDWTNSGNALDYETYWYNRLSSYLTREYYGRWGKNYNIRQCPMSKSEWGENAVWVGVYYGLFSPEHAPFIFLNEWHGTSLTKMSEPYKLMTIKQPANYLMMLDVQRDRVSNPIRWSWDADYDGDSMDDSNSGVLAVNLRPYNWSQPKIHRGGCNVALFDGHVEWLDYDPFWKIGSDGFPVHRYWYNNNHP